MILMEILQPKTPTAYAMIFDKGILSAIYAIYAFLEKQIV